MLNAALTHCMNVCSMHGRCMNTCSCCINACCMHGHHLITVVMNCCCR